MGASYKGETGADFDRLIDRIAQVTAASDSAAIAGLYETEDLAVPEPLLT